MAMEQEYLNPREIELHRDKYDNITLKLPEDKEYEQVKILRIFPLSDTKNFISFQDKDEKEIGIIKDTKGLDRKSKKILDEELEKSYFMPKITQVINIDEDWGIPRWKVMTDKGPREFELRSREDARFFSSGRILIKDIDGNRYEIPDYNKLDDKSIMLIEMEV